MVLRVSSSWAPVPATARTHARGGGGDAGQAGEEVQRRALAREQRAGPAGDAQDGAALVAPDALVDLALELGVGVEGPERCLGGVEAEDHPRRLLDDAGDGAGVGVDRGLGRDVARAHVLGEGLVHELLEAHSCRT